MIKEILGKKLVIIWQPKKRISYYDFLQAFVIIAIIILHVDIYFCTIALPAERIIKTTFHDIRRIDVPIFLIIIKSLLLNRKYPIIGDFLKRIFAE